MQTVHIDPITPKAIILTCTPSAGCPDMTVVQSTTLKVRPPGLNAAIVDVETTVVSKSSTSLVVTGQTIFGKIGIYKLYPIHALASGFPVRGDAQQVQGIDPFDTGGST